MRQAFLHRLSASLVVPLSFLPLAALLLAVGAQLGVGPLETAGLALIRTWLPLFYAIGIAVGFADSDAMAALSVTAGYLVTVAVAEAVSGDPNLNVGVLGGIVTGGLVTWLYNRVKGRQLPEYLGLFSGKRLGPVAATLAGLPLGYILGLTWPPVERSIVLLGEWIHAAGGLGAFVYGASLRLLIPTGLHHILTQLVDTQLGAWADPVTGRLAVGEYVRFLAGDPSAGRILSGFFLTLGFGPIGAALAITHAARPEQRRRVAGLMTTAALTAALLGVTEPIEFAFIFASPVLFGIHVLLSGLASFLGYALDIRLGGYALPMILINWHRSENGLLLLPLGLAYTGLYYLLFRAAIRWLRPPILGQVPEAAPAAPVDPGSPAAPAAADEGVAFLAALGGPANLLALTPCMTRLRVQVAEAERVDDQALRRLGATAVLRSGQSIQVVVGARAGEVAQSVQSALEAQPQPGPRTVVVLSPLSGRVVDLTEVPDPVFAGGLAGPGVAVEPTADLVVAPVGGRVMHIFPGGHALGIETPDGLEVLLHIGIDTVALKGEGFALQVAEGDLVAAGAPLGRIDRGRIAALGKSLITPVLLTNPDAHGALRVVARGQVEAGQPLCAVTLKL